MQPVSNMEEKIVTTKRKILNDIILIFSLLLIAVIGIVYLFCFRSSGDTVKVTVDGKAYGTYSLNKNIAVDIYSGEDNSSLNRLIIKDGKAYVEHATCPDGICVQHRPIFRDGESIVCLPQKVVITVIANNTDEPDIVV